MPQMSPMNWFCLFFLFNFALYMMVTKMYYMFNKSITNNKSLNFKKTNFIYKL